MQQVVDQVADTAHQAVAAGIEDLFDRQRIEQGIGRGQGIVEQREREVGTGAIVRAHVAVVDPVFDLLLPAQISLQAATIKRVEAPCGIGKAIVLRIGRVQGFTQQHSTQLAAQFQGVSGGVHRVAQTMGGNAAQG
ncbi:hypothetical protein D3C86_1612570 [compost metagenome]